MNIGLVTERMITGFGVDLVVDQLARGLAGRGHQVTVYCSRADGTYGDRPYRLRRTPVRPTRAFPWMDRRGRRWANQLDREDLDVIEVHSFPFFSTIPRLGTPVVAVDHGVSLTTGMPLWLRADFAYVRWALYHRYLPSATRVVTISNFLRDQMPKRVASVADVVPWGSEHYWRPVSREERLKYRRQMGIGDETVLALYVGRLNHAGQPYKGVAELLHHHQALVREGLPAGLLCIGFGDHADAATIRRAGGVPVLCAPPGEMPLAYSAADIFVSCSHWEGFGLPLIEAQRFGCPAVAYAAGAHPEIAVEGVTAALVDRPDRFRDEWRSLIADPERRARMSAAAQSHALTFTWDRAVEAHESILEQAASTRPRQRQARRPRRTAGENTLVSVIVLTYEPEQDLLAACLDSVLSSDYSHVELIVVDNASRNGVAERVSRERPGVEFVQTGRNDGFSAGINRGVRESSGELVFLLNPDAQVDPDAIGILVEAARRRPAVAGFAPKMVFAHDPDIIDSVGTAIDPAGACLNRGIGQPDIGQYDVEEPVMGCCFGAAMIQRDAFEPDRVGPLDEAFFLQYEDVDWCFRATIMGEQLWTVPRARVRHVHSATTRDRDYGFKHRLVQRNLLWTVFKNFERRRVVEIFARRSRAHALNALRGHFRRASLRILWDAWSSVPRYWHVRKRLQQARVCPDVDAFKLGDGEVACFDPVNYAPLYGLKTAAVALGRLYVITGEGRWGRALAYLETATEDPVCNQPSHIRGRLTEIAGQLPRPLERFFDRLEAHTSAGSSVSSSARAGRAERGQAVGTD